MDKRGPKDEQDTSSDWKTMSHTDLPPSLKQAGLPPLQPSETKAMHVEPQADTLPPKENTPYNIRAEVTIAGDQILRKHGMASHVRHTQQLHHGPLDGTDNPGYIGDQTYSPNLSGFYYDHMKASKSHDSQEVMRNNTVATMESLPPFLMLSEEIPLESAGEVPVKFANKVLGHVFSFITIPFTCFILALHHLLRFILQGVAKPLVIDTLRLIIVNLVQPTITDVVQPFLAIMRDLAVSVSEFVLELYRSGIAVLRSIRLVEVHITNRHSIQQV